MGDYRYRESGSPHVGLVWWAQIDADGDYIDAANEFWGLAFGVLADGQPSATLIGPSLEPRELHLVSGERAWVVELAAHVFVQLLDKRRLLGEMRDLPTDGRWFELAGVRFPVPDIDELEALVETLFRQGVLAADEGVAAALRGQPVPQSARSLHRHGASVLPLQGLILTFSSGVNEWSCQRLLLAGRTKVPVLSQPHGVGKLLQSDDGTSTAANWLRERGLIARSD